MPRKRRKRNNDDMKEDNIKNERRSKRIKLETSTSNTDISDKNRKKELRVCIREYNKIKKQIKEIRAECERNINILHGQMESQAIKYSKLTEQPNGYCVQCYALFKAKNEAKFDTCHQCELLYCKDHLQYCEDCEEGFCDKKECNTLTERRCGAPTCAACNDDSDAHPDCDGCYYY